MPVSAGTRQPLGAGGMGEVWKARDTRLGRDVAIKVSAERFSDRMEREARTIAALNHPHIATLHDVGEHEGSLYLAMEFVSGAPLKGPYPVKEAIGYGIQLAEGLAAAHEAGIVHRDLKPANVLVTEKGSVKILDFGLAKLREKSQDREAASTQTMAVSGTPGYLAPEQLQGKPADSRSDIFAFGCILYEMVSGRRAFPGDTLAASLAATAMSEPKLIEGAPEDIEKLIRLCLRKDPERRLQNIGDARIALEDLRDGAAPKQAGAAAAARLSNLRERVAWAGMAAFAAVAAVFGFLLLRQEKPLPAPVRFTVETPENGSMPLVNGSWPVVSPDGQSVIFWVTDPATQRSVIYLHNLATGTSRALPGTEGSGPAFWSPDSQSLLVNGATGLYKVDLNTGSLQQLPFARGSASWAPEGIVHSAQGGFQWFRPDGSGMRWIKTWSDKDPFLYSYPTLVPGGRWLVYNAFRPNWATTAGADVAVHLLSVDGKTDRQLLTAERSALYVEPGYLLYLRGGMLMAQAMNPRIGKLSGDPAPVAGPVTHDPAARGTGAFTASNNGVLAFLRGGVIAEDRLVWFDRSGKSLGTAGGVADYSNPALSPDGDRVVVAIRDPGTAKRNIWVLDLARDAASRFTFDPADNFNPAWSPDGSRIAFTSDRKGARDLYVKNASGTGDDELLFSSTLAKNMEEWSPDGRWIVFNEAVSGNADDLVVLSLESRKPQAFLRTRFNEAQGRFSPDGKWLAYASNESGRNEVYIQAFPPSAGKWQISTAGGYEPQWRGDGKELFFAAIGDPARIMAVDIAVKNDAIQAGIPHELFEARLPAGTLRNRFVVTRDGKKFLAVVPSEQRAANGFTVIENWPSMLKKQ